MKTEAIALLEEMSAHCKPRLQQKAAALIEQIRASIHPHAEPIALEVRDESAARVLEQLKPDTKSTRNNK